MVGILRFKIGLGLTIKTASTISPWAYLREGLLSEGFVRLRSGGGGGAYFREVLFYLGGGGLLSEFYGN